MTEQEYWYWLCNIEDMWQRKIKKLLDFFETPESVYKASEKVLRNNLGFKEKDVTAILESKKKKNEKRALEELEKKGVRFIHINMKEYPGRLRSLFDPPYSLYVRGNLPDDAIPAVAIIGARACTEYGSQMAERLAKSLCSYGIQTVSGLARGIDSRCHMGSLAGKGKTFAVLGSGIDVYYPPENRKLMEECVKSGGVISEYPMGTRPLAWQFPHRNRIISGLADKIIVVEAKEKSGSLLTVDSALEQGKDVFALPGRVTDPCSKGCNRLIRQGAMMLTDTEDILEEFGIEKKEKGKKRKKTGLKQPILESEEKRIYDSLESGSKGIQQLIDETGLDSKTVVTKLFRLQGMGLVGEEAQRYYRKIN